MKVKAKEILKQAKAEFEKDIIDKSAMKTIIERLETITGICKECGKDFFLIKSDQIFCSERCSSRFRQRKFRKKKALQDKTYVE